MDGIRQCRECDRSELDTYLSKKLLCRDCARRRVMAQSDLSFDLAEELRYAPKDSLGDGIAKSIAMIRRQYEAARRRRAAEQAALEQRRAEQRKVRSSTPSSAAGGRSRSPARRRPKPPAGS